MTKYILCAALILLSGCVEMTSQAVDSREHISKICIQRNPKVIVPNFTDALQESLSQHNITSVIYDDPRPHGCTYHMTYVAYQRWDFTMFMSNAHLEIYKGDKLIGAADRHMPFGSGFDFSKWDSTTTKVNEMVDQLLTEAAPLQQPGFQ